MQAHRLSGGAAGGDDLLEGLEHHLVFRVQPRALPQRVGEIVGADVDGVDALGADDFLDPIEAFRGLDHGHADDLVVGLVGVVAAAVDRGPDRPERAGTQRRVGGVVHELSRVITVIDHGADDAVGAGVQHLHDHPGIQPRHAHEGHHVGG